MTDFSELEKLPAISRFIERCLVDTVPSGAIPKDITIQLPDSDGAKVPALYSGFPPGLVATDEVSVRATPQDTIKYIIAGSSGASAAKVGKQLDHVLFVSTTAANADYSTIPAAITGASAGDAILLDAETFTITSNLAVSKKLYFFGIPGATKITLATAGTSTVFNTADGTKFFGIEIENTAASGANGACVATNQDIDLIQCALTKTGASSNGYGVWTFTNAVTVKLDNVRVSSTGSGTNYGVKTDSATALNMFGGEYIATDLPIYLNHTGSTIAVQGNPVFGLSSTVTMNAVGAILTDNASGLTANFGDIGLLDEVGDYDDTATEADNVAWCIALTDSIANAQILVKRRGNAIVNYTGSAPSAGEFLVTANASVGNAQLQATMHPAIFAVCTAGGAGGQVAVQLLTGSTPRYFTSTNDMFRIDTTSDSDFIATIKSFPAADTVEYNPPTSGSDDTIDVFSVNNDGKIILYNTDDSNTSALISDTNAGTDVITLTANTPGTWNIGDAIQARSLTATTAAPGGSRFYDLDLSVLASQLKLARAIIFDLFYKDTAAPAGATFGGVYRFDSGPTASDINSQTPQANAFNTKQVELELLDNIICFTCAASGVATGSMILRVRGAIHAVP